MEELGRGIRDAPPTHFILKIQSFSTLSASSLERYESPEFEAADTKWKLAIYPKGNKTKDGQDHISIYLVLSDKSKKDILVTFRLFIFDQNMDKYLTVLGESRFSPMKSEYGFHKFVPLEVFNDAANGYLVNNTCFFGAEVFLIQHTYKLKCLSMVAAKSHPFTYAWKIEKFSNMVDKEYYVSEKFTVWGYDWKLKFHPKGDQTGKGNALSLYLILVDSETCKLPAEMQITVKFKLRIVDQLNKNHFEKESTSSFVSSHSGWGFDRFLSLAELKNEVNGYLVNDSVILEADVIVLGSITDSV